MQHWAFKKPPIVRLPPRSNAEVLLVKGAQLGTIAVGLVAVVFALDSGQFVLAPVLMAIVIGLMFSPVASWLERRGANSAVAAAIVVLLFLLILALGMLALAAPLTTWLDLAPQVWAQLQFHMAQFREPMNVLRDLREELRTISGSDNVTVSVEEGTAVESMAVLAPAIIGQVLLFLASLYFFVATRNRSRNAILRLCTTRRIRWRVAHIFRDVEQSVSRYLLSITVINVGLGVAVGAAMFAIGMPSAALWGALAAILNFVVYLGPAVMAVVLFAVGLTQYDTLSGSLLPPLVYLGVNLIEAQFVTPQVIGKTMLMNPFVVILAIAFWIWLWGPIGGFIAIPMLLVFYAIAANIVPGMDWHETASADALANRATHAKPRSTLDGPR
ncbi:AI-2E family transporter [Aquibium carbonis]|uniref:AI-2E family transporter n=2 Tax=Aquibium carbonis TaxID=2495581 RepID=A0A3R9YDH2_9HYPH|nr:AI-2E family transporter [Aquibium carbonis]